MTTQPPEDPYGTQGGAPDYGSPSYGDATQDTPNPYGGDFPATPGQAPPERPGPLGLAVKLMYAGAGLAVIGILSTFLMLDSIREQIEEGVREADPNASQSVIDGSIAVGIGIAVFIGLIGAGLWVLMAVMNSKGKKWARITATVLGVLGILFSLASVVGVQDGTTGLDRVLSLITAVLAIAILVLLWKKENNPYYEAMSRRFAS